MDNNVANMRAQQQSMPVLEQIYAGSILGLPTLGNEQLGVVLNLGSYYHLCDETQRLRAIEKSLRVLKPGCGVSTLWPI